MFNNNLFNKLYEEVENTETTNKNEEYKRILEEDKRKKEEFKELQNERNKKLNEEANLQIQRNIECRNKYIDSGRLRLPAALRAAPDNQIYFYHGHGGNVCDDDGYPIIKTVPDNCIYITQTVCGIVNTIKPSIIRAFLNPDNADIWRDPVDHLEELKAIFHLHEGGIQGIHIHLPGCSYVETSYYPLGHHDMKKNFKQPNHMIEFSGIMNLEEAHKVKLDSEYIDGIYLPYEDSVNYDAIKNSFVHSFFPRIVETNKYMAPQVARDTFILYPNKENKVSIENLEEQTQKISKNVLVSEIMGRYPGIHFNFLCRSFVSQKCDRFSKKALTLRRRHSAIVQNTISNTFKKLVSMGELFPNKAKGVANDDSIRNYVEAVTPKILQEGNYKQLYDFYDDIRFIDNLDETKEYLRSKIKEPYLMGFLELYDRLVSSKNEKEKQSIKDEISDHIRILNMNPRKAYDTRKYGFENDLLTEIAFSAASFDDEELFDYICGKGNLDKLKTYNFESNTVKQKWLSRCKSIYNRAYEEYPNNSESNRSSNNGVNGGRRKRKSLRRKTLKQKRI